MEVLLPEFQTMLYALVPMIEPNEMILEPIESVREVVPPLILVALKENV